MRVHHKTGGKPRHAVKPELLSPAGDIECVYAAVESGCNAVYAGAGDWSARKKAKNLTPAELEKAVDYCHIKGVKLYAAVNTLIKNEEIRGFMDFVESLYLIGADGVIVQDVGCAALIKRGFPDFYLLASTQMSACDTDGVNFLRKCGFERVILPRELSIEEISAICENTEADIECFIHGALCVCYSGQCLLSAFNGGRSGNRGLCAQPCRLAYELYDETGKLSEGEILSLKDMAGLYAIPSLADCGVNSFKIEGRMKAPEYVAGVTQVYRKYIDAYHENPAGYAVDEKDILTLASLFNRSGFSGGYFNGYSGRAMLTERGPGKTGVEIGRVDNVSGRAVVFCAKYDITAGDGIEIGGKGAYIQKSTPAGEMARAVLSDKNPANEDDIIFRTYDKALIDRLRASYRKGGRKLEIDGVFTARHGEEMSLGVSCGGKTATAAAAPPQAAENAPATDEEVRKRLLKTGGTSFVFRKLEIRLDGNLFISVRELNELRRNALAALERVIIQSHKRSAKHFSAADVNDIKETNSRDFGFSVLVRTEEQLLAASEYDFSRLYIDFKASQNSLAPFKEKGIQLYKCLPRMERNAEEPLRPGGLWDGFLIRTYGQYGRARSSGGKIAIDYTLNVFNSFSADFWRGNGCDTVCVSPELSAAEAGELKSAGTEVVCYGKLALMTTVQCPLGNLGDSRRFCSDKGRGKRCHIVDLKSEKRYDLLTDCENCQCLILDREPLMLPDGFKHDLHRIELSNESVVDVKYIMSTILQKGTKNDAKSYAGRYRSGVK